MNPELDTLTTAQHAAIDNALIDRPEWAPERPAVGITPRLSDIELVTLAVLWALLDFTSQARSIRHAHTHPQPWFPSLPDQPGYNKRLRNNGQLLQHAIAYPARSCPSSTNDVRLVDSTPVECGRNRHLAQRHHQPTAPSTITHRLRPPTPWNQPSRSAPPRRRFQGARSRQWHDHTWPPRRAASKTGCSHEQRRYRDYSVQVHGCDRAVMVTT